MKACDVCLEDRITVELLNGEIVSGEVVDAVYAFGIWTFWIDGHSQHSRPYQAEEDVTYSSMKGITHD